MLFFIFAKISPLVEVGLDFEVETTKSCDQAWERCATGPTGPRRFTSSETSLSATAKCSYANRISLVKPLGSSYWAFVHEEMVP